MVVVDDADEEDSSTARRHRACVAEEEVVALHLPPFTRRMEEAIVGVTNREEGGGVRRFPSRFRRELPRRRRRLGVEGVAIPRPTTSTMTMGGLSDGASPPLLCLAHTRTSARPRRFPRPRRDIRDLRGQPQVPGAPLPPIDALVLVLAQRRLCSARNRSRRYRRLRLLLLLLPPPVLEEGQRSIPSWTTPSRSSVRLSRSAQARARAITLLYRVR